MALQLKYVSHSEIGLVRKNNQDSGYASAHLLVVADGMGGAAAGDLASAVAVDTLRRISADVEGQDMLEVLAGALHRANDRIADLVEDDLTLDGMGTTLTGAMFDGAELGLAHIGDSRAYLLRDGRLERLTHDHSWVQSLVDEGKISADEAAYHPHRSLLLKVLNGQPANDPDLTRVTVRAGDRLMFCSDGVCGLVDDPEIAAALRLPELEEALGQLVALSLAEGGVDNITVIVADVVETGGTTDPAVLGAASERRIPELRSKTGDGAPDPDLHDPDHTDQTDDAVEDDSEDTVITRRPSSSAVPAALTPADEERYTPQAPRRRRLARPLLLVLALALIAGVGLGTAYAWTRTQYYVGAAADRVAIYQGLSESVPGLRLSHVYEVQELAIGSLPAYYQERVRANIDVASLEAARETVLELTETAKRCDRQPPPEPSTSASPTGKPTSSPSPTPTSTPSGSTEPGC